MITLLSISIFFFFGAVPRGFQDLSSPTRDRTWAPALKVWSPNHWTAREFPYNDNIINSTVNELHRE